MEAHAILLIRSGSVLKQENASPGVNDVFETILRDNELRDLATRRQAEQADVSRNRIEHETERANREWRRFDAAQETRNDDQIRGRRDNRPEARNDDQIREPRDNQPEAEDIQATDNNLQHDRQDESQPRADRPGQDEEATSAKAATQGGDNTPITGGAPVETKLDDEGAPNLAASVIATDPVLATEPTIVLATKPTIATTPVIPGTPGAASQKPATPFEAISNAPRPSEIPAADIAVSRAALNSAVAAPVLNETETATAKIIPGTPPVMPAEAGIPLKEAQGKITQAPGQKVNTPTNSTEAHEILVVSDKKNQTPAAAKIDLDNSGRQATANASLPQAGSAIPATQADTNQAPRTNPMLVPPSLQNPGQRPSVASGAVADIPKSTPSTGNTGQAPVGLTGMDPTQTAARAAGIQASSAPATDRPVPPNEVAVTIQRAVARGDDRIRIRLHPAELGQVDVRLKVGADGIVRAVIQVDRPETLDLMQRDARGLERALQDAGLKTDSGSLSFNLRDNGEDGLRDRNGDSDTALAGREQAESNSLDISEAADIPIHTGGSNRVLDIHV